MFYTLQNKDGAKAITSSEERSTELIKRLKAEETGVFKTREEAEASLGMKPTPTSKKIEDGQLPILNIYYYCEPVSSQAREFRYCGLIVENDVIKREVTGRISGNTHLEMSLLGLVYVLSSISEPCFLHVYLLSDSLSNIFKPGEFGLDFKRINNATDQELQVVELLRILLQPHKIVVRKLRGGNARYSRHALYLTKEA